MIQLTTNVLGTFALKNGKVIKEIRFPDDPKEIAKKLYQIENAICPEERQILMLLTETGNKSIKVDNPVRFLGNDLNIEFIEDKQRIDPMNIASQIGISTQEVMDKISRTNLELTKIKLRKLERDQILMQAISSLDDIEEATNRLMERLKEWYSLNFPELTSVTKKPEVYSKIVISEETTDPSLSKKIDNSRKDSIGMEFSKSDFMAVREFSKSINSLYSARDNIEDYIGKSMKEIAPNISELAGPLLGARIISLAGGLKRLSSLPASTIQILGAEESFFRFLKTKKRPPKHGIIFQLPEIRSAKKSVAGRVARTFAAKIAIAAKVDYFGGKFIGDDLRKDFLERVKDLK